MLACCGQAGAATAATAVVSINSMVLFQESPAGALGYCNHGLHLACTKSFAFHA
jgi:hypothetical protein